MITIFKSAATVVAGIAFSIAAVVCAFLLTFVQHITAFFKKTEDVITLSLKGGMGVWGYVLVALVVLAVFELGVFGVLTAFFKYALLYSVVMLAMAAYAKVTALGAGALRRVCA